MLIDKIELNGYQSAALTEIAAGMNMSPEQTAKWLIDAALLEYRKTKKALRVDVEPFHAQRYGRAQRV